MKIYNCCIEQTLYSPNKFNFGIVLNKRIYKQNFYKIIYT